MAEDSAARTTDGRVARAERIRAERRRQVLDCARRVFADKGYHATSIDDIISSARIARGTFYLYFQSKRAIFEELLDSFLVVLQKAIIGVRVGEGATPPLEQMYDNVSRLIARLEENREMTRILIREAVGLDPDFDRKLGDFYGKLHAMIKDGLVLGIAMGLVRQCDADIVARCVLGSIREVASHTIVEAADAASADPAWRDHLAREIMNYNLWGTFSLQPSASASLQPPTGGSGPPAAPAGAGSEPG